jgi:phytoene synthase
MAMYFDMYGNPTKPKSAGLILPLALAQRELTRISRADSDPFVLHAASRLRILWTLWRASHRAEFGG